MKIELTDIEWKNKLPDECGVYRYYNIDNELLYVGKAINLKKRVLSYFKKSQTLSPRIAHMVSKISYIEITITDNETSALLLENNLIKNQFPRYNILFVDDKSYPYIKIRKHDYPVLEYFRGKINSKDDFYGPYPNSFAVKQVIELLQKLFLLRTCSNNEFNNRSRPCMLYQIKRCSAPCVDYIIGNDYQANITNARKFLRGEYSALIKDLTNKMHELSDEMQFEKAAVIRDQITSINDLNDKQIISTNEFATSYDLILTKQIGTKIYFYVIHVSNGLYVGDNNYCVRNVVDFNDAVECFIETNYLDAIVPNIFIDYEFCELFTNYAKDVLNIKIVMLARKHSQLVEMGLNNLQKIIDSDNSSNVYDEAIVELKKLLSIDSINRIECYDISHHGGAETVGAMTVYQNGIINSSLYRRYNLQDTNGDDLKALSIVLQRRLVNSELPIPEIMLIDGGLGQLNMAKKIIKEQGFCDKIATIAIFKGDKRKELNDSVIIDETKIIRYQDNQTIFKLLQPLRDEAHRFSITAHRNKKIKSMTKTKLSEIPGVGAKRRKLLLAYFGDVNSIAKAEINELMKVDGIGLDLATSIAKFFGNLT